MYGRIIELIQEGSKDRIKNSVLDPGEYENDEHIQKLKTALLEPQKAEVKYLKLTRRHGIAPNGEIYLKLHSSTDEKPLTLVSKHYQNE
ncbi:hypothetical protein PR048_002153 [Dryococelus australis]|uniref:Uncharacterized protein n=1 Tax=Dryococelus australis TaxID=614101 RepID=A0ABQ9IJD1_9NEOP|nr:hypothetical protein PR048_002153 [Dryococelus australis]